MCKIVYKGREYDSLQEVCKKSGVDQATFISRFRNGYPLDTCLNPHKIGNSVVVNGKKFNSLAEACDHFNVSYNTVKSYIKEGSSIDSAFWSASTGMTPRARKKNLEYWAKVQVNCSGLLVGDTVYHSLRDACLALGLKYNTVYSRLKRGWQPGKALGCDEDTDVLWVGKDFDYDLFLRSKEAWAKYDEIIKEGKYYDFFSEEERVAWEAERKAIFKELDDIDRERSASKGFYEGLSNQEDYFYNHTIKGKISKVLDRLLSTYDEDVAEEIINPTPDLCSSSEEADTGWIYYSDEEAENNRKIYEQKLKREMEGIVWDRTIFGKGVGIKDGYFYIMKNDFPLKVGLSIIGEEGI